MIQEYEETTIVKQRKIFCDVCKLETMHHPLYYLKCKLCGIDLCNKCVEYEEPDTGDYRVVYCKTCWDKGMPFRQQILGLEEKIDLLYNEWHYLCKGK